MFRAFKRCGKNYPVQGGCTSCEADEITTLKGAGDQPRCIVSIPTENAVAVASGNKIRVYSLDKVDSEATVVLLKHEGTVFDMVNVSGDILVSVGYEGNVIMWHSATGNVIDKLKLGVMSWLLSVAKLDDARIAIGNGDGDLIVVAHNHGTELREIHRISNAHSGGISSIAVDGKKLVTGSLEQSEVWDTSNYERLATFKFHRNVFSVAICAKYIAVAGWSNNIDIYENGADCRLHCTLTTDEGWIKTLTFIDSDTLMVGCHSSISFISVSRHHYLSRVCELENEPWYYVQAEVVRDGRILVINNNRAAIISAPSQVEQQLVQYAEGVIPSPMASNQPSTQIKEVTVVDKFENQYGATEKPDVVMGLSQTRPCAAAGSSVITTSPPEDATTSGEDARAILQAELSEWKERGLEKQNIKRLDTEQVAVCVAAYLVNYNEKRIDQFEEFKTTLMNAFHKSLIEGRSFASAATDEREFASSVAVRAISDMCDKTLVRGAKFGLARFMGELH